MPTPETAEDQREGVETAPQTDRCPVTEETRSEEVRSGVRTTLIEETPAESLMALQGKTVQYDGKLIPCESGTLKVLLIGGKISLQINIVTKGEKGESMTGYIAVNSEGQVVGNDEVLGFTSNTGLNYYFRYAFKGREQELADNFINQLKN